MTRGASFFEAAQNATRRLARLRTRTIVVDGLPVTYDEGRVGAGETVLMLHGLSADRGVWTRFAAGLRHHHLLIPDLAGHGATPFRSGAGYAASVQADRVLSLLDALAIDRAHVIGNSMGGFIAARLALRAPERVLSLGLVDAVGVRSPRPSPLGVMLEQGRNPFLVHDEREFEAFYKMTMAKPPFVPPFVRRMIAADYIRRRDQLAEIFGDIHEHHFLDDRLGKITMPTWILWGRHDQLVDVSTARAWAAGLPRAKLTIYDDLGHMPMLEAPSRTRRDYIAFLRSLPWPEEATKTMAGPVSDIELPAA